MSVETVQDAIGVAQVLYLGSDKHLTSKWRWWCQQLGPTKRLQDVTADDIDLGISALIETPANHFTKTVGVQVGAKQRSPATINRYIASLGSLYKLLKTHRRIPRSFTAPSLKGLRLQESGGRTLQVSVQDVHTLIHAARMSRNHKLPALIAVGATTGLRKGTLQALTWGQINMKVRTIDVAVTKNGEPTRSILPMWAAAELTRIRPDNPEPHWEVFGSKAFKRAWASTIERAEIPGSEGWTFHHLRHVAASILAQSGASLPVIMQALNHKTPSMAIRYSHVNTKALEAAVTKAWN